MKSSEILTQAKQLLIDKGWTQGALARDIYGNGVVSTNPRAVCYCSLGAIAVFTTDNVEICFTYLERILSKTTLDYDPIEYNDKIGRTKEEVLAKFDEAIALAQSEGD